MLAVSERIAVDRPLAVVQAQFADVAYHARSGHHQGVTFVVVTDDADRCTYQQVTRAGPVRLRQSFELDRRDPSKQVNTITAPLLRRVLRRAFWSGTHVAEPHGHPFRLAADGCRDGRRDAAGGKGASVRPSAPLPPGRTGGAALVGGSWAAVPSGSSRLLGDLEGLVSPGPVVLVGARLEVAAVLVEGFGEGPAGCPMTPMGGVEVAAVG